MRGSYLGVSALFCFTLTLIICVSLVRILEPSHWHAFKIKQAVPHPSAPQLGSGWVWISDQDRVLTQGYLLFFTVSHDELSLCFSTSRDGLKSIMSGVWKDVTLKSFQFLTQGQQRQTIGEAVYPLFAYLHSMSVCLQVPESQALLLTLHTGWCTLWPTSCAPSNTQASKSSLQVCAFTSQVLEEYSSNFSNRIQVSTLPTSQFPWLGVHGPKFHLPNAKYLGALYSFSVPSSTSKT